MSRLGSLLLVLLGIGGLVVLTGASAGGPDQVLHVQRVVSTPIPTPTPVPTPAPALVPTRGPAGLRGTVEIPSIGARGPLVATGLDAAGEMVLPRNAKDVAWLDNGGFPGPTRNAILAGHRNYSGASGTFERLEHASVGDEVLVTIDGAVHRYRIVWLDIYDPDAPVEELLGPTEVDSITLVTCGGPFDRSSGHYTKRWVARAEAVASPPPMDAQSG